MMEPFVRTIGFAGVAVSGKVVTGLIGIVALGMVLARELFPRPLGRSVDRWYTVVALGACGLFVLLMSVELGHLPLHL